MCAEAREAPPLPVTAAGPAEAPAAGAWAGAAAGEEGPPVGSMRAVLDLQADCFADDVGVTEEMASWGEGRLRAYFESGGEDPRAALVE